MARLISADNNWAHPVCYCSVSFMQEGPPGYFYYAPIVNSGTPVGSYDPFWTKNKPEAPIYKIHLSATCLWWSLQWGSLRLYCKSFIVFFEETRIEATSINKSLNVSANRINLPLKKIGYRTAEVIIYIRVLRRFHMKMILRCSTKSLSA